MSKKKRNSYISVWLEVDEDNKKVLYKADPLWMKNTSDEEQKKAFAKLTATVNAYRRAGYVIIKMAKIMKK